MRWNDGGGDSRWERGFAWFPLLTNRCMRCKYRIWLERYMFEKGLRLSGERLCLPCYAAHLLTQKPQ